ncbi:MAG: hypothetical protein R2702_14615 [Acidimicrobiales bacterium]
MTATAAGQPDVGAEAPARARRLRPAPIHRVRDLPPTSRLAVQAALVGLALVPLLSAAIVLLQGWRPTGDNALIGLRVHDVLSGHPPLIGQPTTGENFGSGIETSHPGPIEFYLVAPFVLVLGPAVGLALGAAAINAGALVAIGWLAHRRGGTSLLAVGSLGALAMAHSLGGNLLHDPVSSNVGSFVALALLYASWSVIAGDLRVAPLFVALASFSLQDHLTYLGTGTPVVVVALAAGVWWARRIAGRGGSGWLRRSIASSVVVGLVLWLPVLLDELVGSANVNAIFRTFTGKRTPGEGAAFAAGRVAEALAPVPIFARRVAPLGYLHTPALHEWLLGIAVLAWIVVAGVLFARRADVARAAMALVSVLALVAGGYSAVKLPVGAGIQGSNLRWMWTASAFGWTTAAWTVWPLLPAFWRRVVRGPAAVVLGLALLASVVSVVGSVELATDRDGAAMEGTDALIREVEAKLPKGTYRVTYEGGSAVVSVGPALVHDLEQRGDAVFMDVGPFTRAYADHREFDGQRVDGTIVISSEARASYPEGTRLLVRQELQVNREEAAINTIRVYYVEGQP